MSNQQTIAELQDIRTSAIQANQQLITLSHLAADGRVTLRDFVTLTRVLTGGNEDLSSLMMQLQTTIALVGTARTVLRLLEVELGPAGWLLLGGATLAGVMGADQLMRRPQP